MRRNIIIGLAVAMLCGVVFMVTLVSQYSGSAGGPGEGESVNSGPVVPLSFTADKLFYSPTDENINRRHFPGFYEVSSSLVPAPFWFQNPHAEPVTVTVRGRSCTACTSARLAVIPASRVDRLAEGAFADLALGANSPTGLLLALSAVGLMQGLDWQQLDFEAPDKGAIVPAAESPDRPTWGVFQMEIKVNAVGPQDRRVLVGTKLGERPMATQEFAVKLVGAAPFALDQAQVTLGELPEGSGARTVNVNAWSATRDFDRFPPPQTAINSQDGFVQVGEPVPLTLSQRIQLEAGLHFENQATPVRSGYRIPITVYRRRPAGVPGEGPAEPEIGPFERTVQLAGPNNSTASLKVSGTVTGVVTLQGASLVDLKDFNGKLGVSNETFTLISDRPEVTLAIDPETSPRYLKVELGEPGQFGPNRRRWQLTVSVPPEACYGDLPRDAAIVLIGKSNGEPFRLRLPVKGRGFRRGS